MLKNEVKVDGRAWLPKSALPAHHLKRIRKALTVRLKPSSYDDGPRVVEMFEERDFHIGVPRGYYERTSRGRLPVEYDICEDKRTLIPAVFARDEMQEEGVRTLTERLKEKRATGAILEAATGTGKTVMGLLIAGELRMPTLIVVHLGMLMDQWVERILEKPGVFPDAKVGIFRGDTEEFGDDYDIVVAMVHTLCNRPPDHPIFSWPGLIIVDECHRIGAPTWNSVAHRFNAAKRLGLTATPRRRDGGEQLFFDTVGPIAWTAKVPMLIPKVRKVETGFVFEDNAIPKFVEDRVISRNLERNSLIVREAAQAYKTGRNLLLLTKRVGHALILKRMLERHIADADIGICVGEWYVDEKDAWKFLTKGAKKYRDALKTKGKIDPEKVDKTIHKISWANKDKTEIKSVEPKRKKLSTERFADAVEKDIIIATYQMVQEGFDVPRLDTLFICMPVFDPVQATGRILRSHPTKKDPIVTHFIDAGVPKYASAWQSCRRHYQDLGANV